MIFSFDPWFNPQKNSFEYNQRWAQLRAIEWAKLPEFLSLALAPISFLFWTWWKVIVVVVLLGLLWVPIQRRFVNLRLSILALDISHLKWPSAIIVAVYFVYHRLFFLGLISILYPTSLISTVFEFPFFYLLHQGFHIKTPSFGEIEERLLFKMGYHLTERPSGGNRM
ncbi:MAG: hypothetical protein KGH56_01645 [Patescibacteria group bacterium]|nr:hypothetical protein [Patescibacteria group bacterium]